jgi:hypothetical protein
VSDRPDLFDDMFGLPDDDFPGRRSYTPEPHPMPCPPLGVFLAYADEHDMSISPRRRARIFEHVRCCESCQMHLERAVDGVLHGLHEIYKEAYEVNQAAVLRGRETRFRRELHTQNKVLTPPLGSTSPQKQRLPIAPIAATLAALAVGVMLLRPAAVVIHAEELIDRAIAYDREHIAGLRQRVRRDFSTGMMALTRPVPGLAKITAFSDVRDVVGGTVSTGMRLVAAGDREPHDEITRLFAKHHFDWNRPLCLTCYREWRGSLSRKHDTTTLTGDMLVLTTTTSEGELREVTLTFRRDPYRLVRQTFLFEGLGHFVIEEQERHEAAPASQLASAAASRAVVDAGTGTLAPGVGSRPPAVGDPSRSASRRPALSRWLDRTFPSSASAARSAFLPDIERRSSSVRQHLIELQRLASISESAKVKNGTDAERAVVQQQVELEYQALITHLSALEGSLSVLFGNRDRSLDFPTVLPTDWERRASTAMPHATRLEHRLQRIFTRDDLPPEDTKASRPRSARASFEALWESIHGVAREIPSEVK